MTQKMSKQAIEYDEVKKRDLHARQRMKELKQLMAKQTLLVCVCVSRDVMMNCFCVYLMLNTNEANMIWNSTLSIDDNVCRNHQTEDCLLFNFYYTHKLH
eukprot:736081_1